MVSQKKTASRAVFRIGVLSDEHVPKQAATLSRPTMGPGTLEATFLVQGSAPDPYQVTFLLNGQKLSGYCTCAAGENGQYCKHRFSILSGTTHGIVSDNFDQVPVVDSWLPGTSLEAALNELAEKERDLQAAQKPVSAAKKKVAEAFR